MSEHHDPLPPTTLFDNIPHWAYFVTGGVVGLTITTALLLYFIPSLRRFIFPFRDREHYIPIKSEIQENITNDLTDSTRAPLSRKATYTIRKETSSIPLHARTQSQNSPYGTPRLSNNNNNNNYNAKRQEEHIIYISENDSNSNSNSKPPIILFKSTY